MFLVALSIVSCTQKNNQNYQLGQARLEVTGSQEAKDLFDKGLLLLHSFEYWDATDAFIEAQTADPTMVMAYWGEAMTYNHPLWRAQDYSKGQAALKKLADSPEERSKLLPPGLEKDLFQAVEILYGEGEKFTRDKAYAQYMGELYAKYPSNHEVAAFYAISLLGAVEEGRDEKEYEKGAIVAQGILQENPNHPGALHYLIHSYDDPKNAHKALDAANSYSKVAKDAGHALHMPSHIYVALGMWDEVVSSNEASFQASAERAQRKNLKTGGSYHALHWLMYGYLQQGKLDAARQLMDDMQTYMDNFPNKGARDYMIAMKGTFLVETSNWLHPKANIEVEREDLLVSTRSVYTFIEGMKAFENGNKANLKTTIESINKDRSKAMARINTRNVTMCGGNWQYEFPNQLDIEQSHVMEMELSALSAWLDGDTTLTRQFLTMATTLEEEISYSFGPPLICKPSHELFGEWLLEMNEPENAIVQFEKALQRAPKRILSLKGKLKAYGMLSMMQEQQKLKEELNSILKNADAGLMSFVHHKPKNDA